MDALHLAIEDDGRSFEIATGSTVVVVLAENPTTGYRWAVDQLDSEILALERSEFERGMLSGIGAGGMRKLAFTAHCAGTTDVVLKLSREWLGDMDVGGRFAVSLKVL
jgi:inhibitor of cysteine peptidase